MRVYAPNFALRVLPAAAALLFASGCDETYRKMSTPPLSNVQIIAAKAQCDAAGMKVQVHLKRSYPVSAVCVPVYVPADQVQHDG